MEHGKALISSWESDEQAGRIGDPAYYLARAGRETELTRVPRAM